MGVTFATYSWGCIQRHHYRIQTCIQRRAWPRTICEMFAKTRSSSASNERDPVRSFTRNANLRPTKQMAYLETKQSCPKRDDEARATFSSMEKFAISWIVKASNVRYATLNHCWGIPISKNTHRHSALVRLLGLGSQSKAKFVAGMISLLGNYKYGHTPSQKIHLDR